MKKIAVLFLCLTSIQAFAMSKAEICSWRSQLVESFAHARDNGKSEGQVASEVKRTMRQKFGTKAPDMKGYVEIVFQFRTNTPKELKQVTYMSCLNE